MAINLFTTQIIGPPPGTATTALEQWVDLGLIPTGSKIWMGAAQYSSPDKSITFELRTNLATKSTGTTGNTKILDNCAVSPKSGTLTRDLYKNGSLHIVSTIGAGVEHWWLRLVSKSSTAGGYLYKMSYTLE